jgi:D-glycero-D-manno-heptose 1,7-bisphosphate phosphatase
MVGDRWRDIEAGSAAGCQTILIDRGYREGHTCWPDWVAADLRDAADWIIRNCLSGATTSTSGDV